MAKAGANQQTKLLTRAKEINNEIEEHQAAIAGLSQERRECLETLIDGGMTQAQLAEHLSMSRGRVSQLLSAGVRPERAFFGSGKVTVAIGGKPESGRADGKTQVVASSEAHSAAEQIIALVRTLGLDAESEIVPPPGMVQLNRPNLVVLTSPRLLPFVGQMLDADPHLGFGVDDEGWFLVDKASGDKLHSPSDRGETTDLGYIGRLPRPDGRGTFLYFAGLHAPGTAGAVHYVENNLPELYREVKTRRWSALISCEFDGKSRKIVSSKLITPLYRHDNA